MKANNADLSPAQLEVLILAPTGQDATLIAKALARESIGSAIFTNIDGLCARINNEAGAVIIAEEALSQNVLTALKATLEAQERWSDIPLIVMTGTGETSLASARVLHALAPSGNVTLLERPFRSITLLSTMQVALRARRRQYEVRGFLNDQIEATRIRDEFISVAGHELKTPLTTLKLQTQMNKRLQRRNPQAFPEKITRLIDVTDTQVDRLTRLVEDMLDVSRVTSGKLKIEKSTFDLCELVSEVADSFKTQLKAARCALDVECKGSIVGHWDKYRIEQVINNLITNAIRYSPGCPVRIGVVERDNRAVITVEDQGTGIAPEHQARIFERFERAVVSRSITGLGLGLYICRQIVESHQGTIHVESALGQGSKFMVELPIVQANHESLSPQPVAL